MAAYYHGGAGTDIHQAASDGLQTLYLMNPSYGTGGYGDAAPSGANMMLLNSAVSSMTPASFGGHQASPPPGQHFVGIPLQVPPSGYNLWTPATTGIADVMSPPTQQAHGVSAVLSLSSRETPPVTVASIAGDEGRYHLGSTTAASQGQVVMNSKYLRAAQELLDEVVSVSKGVDDVDPKAKSAVSVKKKEDSEGLSGGGGEEGASGAKGGAPAPEMSTAERQELQMKKGKLVNMLDEVEQRYRQYHQQMASVSSSFEAVAGAGSARTYTALALRTISRQFRCLRDAIASQVRAASRALGEDCDAEGLGGGLGGGPGVGSRLRYIDHQLRQQRALQQLGMMQSSAWRPQRGLPERSVSILRAWLFEHFLHPYPKDSDKIMLAKQTGLTRSQVSNWFINARVRLWKPMVEEMYLEETKEHQQQQDGGDDKGRPSGSGPAGGKSSSNADGVDDGTPRSMARAAAGAGTSEGGGAVQASLLELAGEHQAHAGFYDEEGEDGGLRRGFKKARAADLEQQPPAAFDFGALHHAQAAAAAAARQQHDEVSHRELLMKFMESGGAAGARDHHHQHQHDEDGAGGGYSLFAPGPYGQFGTDQSFAFPGAGQHGGVSLTLGLPHGAGDQTAFLMGGGSSNGADSGGSGAAGYDMNMQTTKSFAAQLMRDFVA
ncbi:hypothetical protein CFC21_057094 [Triticum aestivum]|uniref:Homeobox domain-containing protein n=2 Tax=Triticum aestivum TaxID=4565 RepID=A0A9R1GKG7_WHEAT|nr:BEL1-like homeodomain protein 1 [Triticum aestivum]KAF7048300.1 hypothetical protein CFC21_057094 [Triticum aestivum]